MKEIGGQPGNKNAEKWTVERSIEFLDGVYRYILEHEDCCSISEACSELGWYEEVFSYIQKKHKDFDFQPLKKASELIKQRIIKKGLNSKYNPVMSIFVLKNNHGMEDKHVNDQNINTPLVINVDGKQLDL